MTNDEQMPTKAIQHPSPRRCLVTCLLAFTTLALAQQTPPAETPSAPSCPARPAPPPPDFAAARRLMQQCKIDEAISQLQALQANAPEAKGLDLELGTAYYKKGEYAKAVESLKKASSP